MTDRITVVTIDPDGTIQEFETKDDLDAMQGIVGGYIEMVSLADGVHAYCDEEGKLKSSPINVAATDVAHALGWPRGDVLCGTVVFLGETSEGEEASLPEDAVAFIKRIAAGA